MCQAIKPAHEKYHSPEVCIHGTELEAEAHAKEEAARINGKPYRVNPTGSMSPTLDGGDYVVGLGSPLEDASEGDIVNYLPEWNQGKLTIHRLVKKDKDGWIASGDNNRRYENWERVTKKNYVDKIVSIHRAKVEAKKQ